MKPASRRSANAIGIAASFFSERAPRKEQWKIYVNPEQGAALNHASEMPSLLAPDWKAKNQALLAAAENAGAGPGEIPVGILRVGLKSIGETWMEQHTTMDIDLPEGIAPAETKSRPPPAP